MAGRISRDFIQRLIDRVDIVDFLGAYMDLKRAGREYKAICPFHDDTKPSLTISPQKQFYHCFACGASGNTLKFLTERERLEFPDAVEVLANFAGMAMEYDDNAPRAQRRQGPNPSEVLQNIANWYTENLRKHKPGIEYLKTRNLSGAVIKEYGLGYAPNNKDHIDKLFATDAAHENLLLELGMIVEDERGRRARFRNRLMFPIRDARGRVVGFGGRVLSADGIPKYLNSSDSFLFKKGELLYGQHESRTSKAGHRLMVEGYTDVLGLVSHGVDFAVATLGTAATDEHFRKLFRVQDEVILCFDGDTAGVQAASRAFATALPRLTDGKRLRIMFMPEGQDPDTFISSQGKQAFDELQQQALSPDQFIGEHLSKPFNLKQVDEAAAYAQEVAQLIALLPKGGVLQELLLAKLSEHIGLSEQVLRQKMQEAVPRATVKAASATTSPPPSNAMPDYADEFAGTPTYSEAPVDIAPSEAPVPASTGTPENQAEQHLRLAIRLLYQSASSENIGTDYIKPGFIDDLKTMQDESPYARMLLDFYDALVVASDREARDMARGQWQSQLAPAMAEPVSFPANVNVCEELNRRIHNAVMTSGARPQRLYSWLQQYPNQTDQMDVNDAVAVRKLLHNDERINAELRASLRQVLNQVSRKSL